VIHGPFGLAGEYPSGGPRIEQGWYTFQGRHSLAETVSDINVVVVSPIVLQFQTLQKHGALNMKVSVYLLGTIASFIQTCTGFAEDICQVHGRSHDRIENASPALPLRLPQDDA